MQIIYFSPQPEGVAAMCSDPIWQNVSTLCSVYLIFGLLLQITGKQCKIRLTLLLNMDKKSYLSFPLTHFTLTLGALDLND